MRSLRILRRAAVSGFADLASIYTWKTYVFGWLLRVTAQVGFFALIGRLLDSDDATAFLLVGHAVMIAAIEGMMVVPSTTWERRAGTLPLLVAAPGSPALIFLGRSVQWLPSGVVSSCSALLAMSAAFGLALPWPRVLWVLPLVALVGAATYCFGLVLAGVVLRFMETRNVVSNVAYLCLMAFCGVSVPVDFWPGWVQAAVQVLPLTHGLEAIRGLLTGDPVSEVAARAAMELSVCAGWLAVALLVFTHLAESGRRDGSIEFAD